MASSRFSRTAEFRQWFACKVLGRHEYASFERPGTSTLPLAILTWECPRCGHVGWFGGFR